MNTSRPCCGNTSTDKTGPSLLKPHPVMTEKLDIGDSLLQLNDDDTTAIIILNQSDSTCKLQKGEIIGTVWQVGVINSYKEDGQSLLGTDSEADLSNRWHK